MPIKGVSEVIRLPRLGKIRLGVKKETAEGVPYPSPTDYFVCPDEVRKVFGEKPRELRIMLPTEDETQWASQYLRCYSATRGLICRGDGLTAVARAGIHSGEVTEQESDITELLEVTCNPGKCVYYQQSQCRRVMNLQFLLPDCPGFGVYQLDTGSFYSIVNINSALRLIRGVCGRLSMIPLSLRLIEQEVRPEGIKKTVRVLSLSARYSLAEIQRFAQMPPGQALLLPAPDGEAPDDLFPDETLRPGRPASHTIDTDKALIDLWDRVKIKVRQMEIQDAQIGLWFRRNYRLDVCLADFSQLTPPARITSEHLEHFLRAIEFYSNQI